MLLSQTYLELLKHEPELASRWIHEDSLPKRNGYRPDAIIASDETIAIEVLGSGYDAANIQTIWQSNQNRRLILH